MKVSNFKYVIFIPSFYGAVFFSFFYLIYLLNVIEYEVASIYTHIIFLFSTFFFITSTLVNIPKYSKVIIVKFDSKQSKVETAPKLLIIFFFLIGYFGFYQYLSQVMNYLGGFSNYLLVLVTDGGGIIREGGDFNSSAGIQLTYFSWVASGLVIFYIQRNLLSKKWWVLVIFTFIQNLFFIDRTRPIWILFTLLLIAAPLLHNKIDIRKIFKYFFGIIFLIIIIFTSIATFSGKVAIKEDFKGWDLPPEVIGFVNYGTSPFAYFNHMIETENIQKLNFDRTIYPLLKITSSIGLTEEPTSLINDYYYVPTPTNVGTFLEPFYRDGGFLYLFIGIFIHSFFLNHLGLYFLRNCTSFGLYAYSNLCFINLISFFTPKINNFPIWFFVFIGFLSIIIKKLNNFK